MYRHLEGGRGLNEKRSHARHTRTRRASGVTGGVVHSVRYCVDDAVSINSAPSVSVSFGFLGFVVMIIEGCVR